MSIKRALPFLLLCAAVSAFGQGTLYQFCSFSTASPAVSSLACGNNSGTNTFSQQVQPHHLLIASSRTCANISSVTDTIGLTFVAAAPAFGSNSCGPTFPTYWVAQTGSISAQNDTITVTANASTSNWGIMVAECANCATTSPTTPAVCQSAPSSSSTTWSCGPFTTQNNNELILAGGGSFGGQTITPGASFTARYTETANNAINMEDRSLATAGSITPSATVGSANSYAFAAAAFKTGGSYSYVNSCQGIDNTGNNDSTFSVTCSWTAGNFVGCIASWRNGTSISAYNSLTDNQGDLFPNVSGWVTNSLMHMRMHYAANVVGGSTTVTMNGNNMQYPEIVCLQYSGVATTAPLDVSSLTDAWAYCSNSCYRATSGVYTGSTINFPTRNAYDFAVEYGDFAGEQGAGGCAAPWVYITEDGNGSQWCYASLYPSSSYSGTMSFTSGSQANAELDVVSFSALGSLGFSNAFVF